jgi:hypothetical protein
MTKTKNIIAENKMQAASNVAPAPWSCHHEAAKSRIDAYLEATGEWETIIEIHAQKGIDAKATAEFIVQVTNDNDRTREALSAALSAITELVSCAGERITFDAEREADIAERKIKDLLTK